MLTADAIAFSRNSREFNSRDYVSLRGGARGSQEIGRDIGSAEDCGQDHGGEIAAAAAAAGSGTGEAATGTGTGRGRYVFSDDDEGGSRVPKSGGGGRGARSSDEATRKKALATSLYWCVRVCEGSSMIDRSRVSLE